MSQTSRARPPHTAHAPFDWRDEPRCGSESALTSLPTCTTYKKCTHAMNLFIHFRLPTFLYTFACMLHCRSRIHVALNYASPHFLHDAIVVVVIVHDCPLASYRPPPILLTTRTIEYTRDATWTLALPLLRCTWDVVARGAVRANLAPFCGRASVSERQRVCGRGRCENACNRSSSGNICNAHTSSTLRNPHALQSKVDSQPTPHVSFASRQIGVCLHPHDAHVKFSPIRARDGRRCLMMAVVVVAVAEAVVATDERRRRWTLATGGRKSTAAPPLRLNRVAAAFCAVVSESLDMRRLFGMTAVGCV